MSTLRCVAWPSSSKPSVPHSPAIVPSSISVTFGEATCSPTLPAYTLAPLAMASASSPWPHASWNSTPPLPRLMTTGIVPDGAGRASSLVVAIRAASRASASTSTRSNVSNPTVWPTDWKPVCIPVSPSATTLIRDMQRVIASSVSTPSVLATRTSLRLSAYDADTCTTDLPDERAASSMRRSSSTLVDFGTPLGSTSTWLTWCQPAGSRATVAAPPVPLRAAAAAASAAAVRPRLGEVAGVGVAGRFAGQHAHAGAAVAAAVDLLDAAVVEAGRRRTLVLGVDLGEVAAGTHRRRQHSLEDVVVDHPPTLPARTLAQLLAAASPMARIAPHVAGAGLQALLPHLVMKRSTSTTTRTTLPTATRPRSSEAETVNVRRRPSTLTSTASAITSAPTADGWRWSRRTLMPTVVELGGQLAGDGPAARLLAQGDQPRRAEHGHRPRPEGDRRVRLGDDELGLASQSGRDTHDTPGYGAAPRRAADQTDAPNCDRTARLLCAPST